MTEQTPDEWWVMTVLPVSDAVQLMKAIVEEREGSPIYLASYDPNGHGGYGDIVFTDDVTQAKRFATTMAVLEEWKRVSATHPLRPDGKPNRPLSAYSINPRRVTA